MVDRLREGSKSSVEEQRDNAGINQHNHFYSDVQIKLVIPNHHGENLVGILHDTSSKELVIVCHGIKSVKERIPMVSLAAAIGKTGISAFRFDFAGNGESEGSFRYGNYHREAEDLHAVAQHFRGIGRIITMIVGHSKGKFQYRVTKKSLMDRLSTDVRSACHLISEDCRVLTIHGSMDQIVPVKDALEFDEVIANHTLRIIDGADHEFTLHQNELVQVTLDFIRNQNQCDDTADALLFHARGRSSICPKL
ncbi:uncharacterized protein LOC104886624 isoform X2 [Beta vulgaris subsp. vulgaris]|uniref:uncharacterized protein LOC104886624 isoform X2 n=1 Tax=Beta vulgaris subsp. vulgaris TaxID=3555 RepID=UPI002548228A|nr:uncharacterized protein LOC104886624 isoform X2 [Beta vulgaris subsp. vulgaris]